MDFGWVGIGRTTRRSAYIVSVLVLCLLPCSGCGSGGSTKRVHITSNFQRQQASQSGFASQSTVALTNAQLANQEDLPHVKQLRLALFADGFESYGVCTATFITPQVLLTAAHCLYNLETMEPLSPSDVEIEIEPGRFIPASILVPHPEFTGRVTTSTVYADTPVAAADVGVILASEQYAGPLPVFSPVPPQPGETMVLAGYGLTSDAAIFSGGTLRVGETTIDAVSPAERLLYWIQDSPNEASTCHGDSGGPAFTVNAANELVLVGITSSGDPGCRPYHVAVDSLVSSYLDWISAAAGGGLLIK